MVERLPSKRKALGSVPISEKKEKRKKKRNTQVNKKKENKNFLSKKNKRGWLQIVIVLDREETK